MMLLFPMESYAAFYSADRVETREENGGNFQDQFNELVAFQEDLFAYGPPMEVLRDAFDGAGFFHVEMFEALPGRIAKPFEPKS